MAQHSCESTCLNKRNIRNQIIKCWYCELEFNSKCYNINATTVKSLSIPDCCIIFICPKCRMIISKLKQSRNDSRKSTTVNRPRLSSTSCNQQLNGITTNLSHSSNNSTSVDNNNIKLLELMNTLITKFDTHSIDMKHVIDSRIQQFTMAEPNQQQCCNNNMYDMIGKIDDISTSTSAIHSKITELQLKVSELRNSNITHSDHDSRTANAFNKYKNALDWNFSFNQTINSRASTGLSIESSDLFTVIDNFERNTWSSLDALTNVLIEQNAKLTDVANEIDAIDSRLSSLDSNNRIICATGNLSDTNKLNKEAIALSITQTNVPETLKINEQKMINHNSSVIEPRISLNIQDNYSSGQSSTDAVNSQLINEDIDMETRVLNAMNELDTVETPPSNDNNINSQNSSSYIERFSNELYVSNFSNDITSDMIRTYLNDRNIDTSEVRITCLIPKNKDRSTLSYISFKVDTNDCIASIINKTDFWPAGCFVKNFINKKRANIINSSNMAASSSSSSFLFKQRLQTQIISRMK